MHALSAGRADLPVQVVVLVAAVTTLVGRGVECGRRIAACWCVIRVPRLVAPVAHRHWITNSVQLAMALQEHDK